MPTAYHFATGRLREKLRPTDLRLIRPDISGGSEAEVGPLERHVRSTSTADIGELMPHVRLGALKPDHHRHHCGAQMPHLHHDLCVHPDQRLLGRAAPMTARFDKTTEEEFEVQARNFLRLVSACTLGLWSFSAGLLIGSFYLF